MRYFAMFAFAATLALPGFAAESAAINGFDASALDRAADPCDNFYQFACGGWIAKNEIPPDQPRWGRFDELAERNRRELRDILENSGPAGEDGRKIRDFYDSCMDEKAIDSLGLAPLKPYLDRIDSLNTGAEIFSEIARLQAEGMPALFLYGSTQDFKDAEQVIAEVDQGGLGLPDRDYYLKTDAKSVQLLAQYGEHIRKMFSLLGYDQAKSSEAAKTVVSLETELARASLDKVSRREPANVYHRMTVAELSALAPDMDWKELFAKTQAPALESLNVATPEFFRQASRLLSQRPPEDWKTYLRWHTLSGHASRLSSAVVNEDFDFYGKTLKGAKELRPRWKRCVAQTDDALGEALGKRYAEKTLGAEGKAEVLRMIRNIEDALGRDIGELDWMDAQTKKQALAKLKSVANKIGYPDKWRDYSALEIKRGDEFGNAARADSFEFRRQLAKIGKPVDRAEWHMTPPTVNAYYSAQLNSINFPAGILQPPFYGVNSDIAVNYGGIGAVMGHELTHGFDDKGRKFDDKGNMRDWWSPQDSKEYDKRSECFVTEYSSFTAVDDIRLNGKLTLGENTADNGGLRLALMALNELAADKLPLTPGSFTAAQRLFLGYAQVWCSKQRDEYARLQVMTDPHSLPQWRVNGVMVNMPEFSKAFSCGPGKAMYHEDRCRVW